MTAVCSDGVTRRSWRPNAEADLAGYRLYRGTAGAFPLVPSARVAAPGAEESQAVDAAGAPCAYALTAVDAHGNESGPAITLPAGTAGVDGGAWELSFAPPRPSPARETTTLEYTLSCTGPVRLSLLDVAGRQVATVRDGLQVAGTHRERAALRDGAGRAPASGIYLARLEAEGRVLTRRLAVIR